jgi:photosystem II stability/assembly factor-like uncharacterized protein
LIADPFGAGGVKGVFKSEDNGETWHTKNRVAKKNDLDNVSVNSLLFDSKDRKIIYLGAANGIYKSEDEGESWKFILTGITVSELSADPFGEGKIYAAGLALGKGKIIKSADGGNSWIDIYTEASKGIAVTSITVSKTNPLLIFAGLASGEILRSTDSGQTWQTVKDVGQRLVKLRFGGSGKIYALARGAGLLFSSDLGNSWTTTTSSLTTPSLFATISALPQVTIFHDLALDGSIVYLGTEQGLFVGRDEGTAWSFVNLPVKSSPVKVASIGVNPSNSNNIFVTIFSTVFKSVNKGLSWETEQLATNQSGRVILINPQSPNVIYLGVGEKK